MRTNIVLDGDLVNEAFALTGLKTKRELIDFALRELVHHKRKPAKKSLCDAFETLHKLGLDDNPFPEQKREIRQHPFL